jgi:phospholipase C
VIDALVANPDVFSRTVLFINYDEEGGFFDHMVPPTPPRSRAEGWSSVDTRNEIFPGDQDHISGPYGLGVRVPMLVVSPWSKGGWVNSQVFDHTSLIRFLEARFAGHHSDLIETNITPWRRAISGDLTTAFDFSRPEAWRDIKLPSTSAYLPPDFDRHPDNVPAPPSHQRVPAQERGVRPARALPYRLSALGGQMAGGLFQIEFANSGQAAAVFQVRSAYAGELPRTYTVGPHKKGTDTWNGLAYDLSVYGPNGFFRRFAGSGAVAGPNIEVREQYEDDAISVRLTNHGERDVRLHIVNAYAGNTIEQRLLPHESETLEWPLRTSWGWYDLLMTVAGDPSFVRQLAGHVENGEDSISDPAMGRVVLSD